MKTHEHLLFGLLTISFATSPVCAGPLFPGDEGYPRLPGDFSFQGSFSEHDDSVLFSFSLDFDFDVDETVYLLTYGYGGGTQADGNSVGAGGFDPHLTLFDSAGGWLDEKDDFTGTSCFSAAEAAGSGDAGNVDDGNRYDACMALTDLDPGSSYILALTHYDNLSVAYQDEGNLTDGFEWLTSNPGGFYDKNGKLRSPHWAVDFLNVSEAYLIPAPAPLALMAFGLLGLACLRRRRAR